ncbi:MAG: acyl-CoA dehydrogenase family protein [Thermoanaerobaculia bacterium]
MPFADFPAAARALAPQIRERAAQIEAARALPQDLLQSLAAAGLFQMWVARAAGGHETDPLTNLRVIEELSRADAAVGWVVMIATGTSLYASARLAPEVAREIYGRDPADFSCGFVPPCGRAVEVPGGYRVSGRWYFGSGCRHAAWLMAPCWLGDEPAGGESTPPWRTFVVPARDCEILDTWNALGMRGTGSHDYTATDLFVPHERSFSLLDPPLQPGPLYAHTGLFLLNMAGVPLGLARGALDSFAERAHSRGEGKGLAEMAQAQALVEAARAFIYGVTGELWETLSAGRGLPVELRARYRLALTHSFTAATQAIDLLYQASGIGAIAAGSPIERAFRDAHTMAHHRSVCAPTYSWIGKMLLGRVPRKAVLQQFA